MNMKCKTPKDLADAMKNKADFIIIEGDLKNKVIRIKATGKAAWGVCIVSLGAAIAFYLATPAAFAVATPVGGTVVVANSLVATTAAATTLGSAVLPAIAIGVAAGGVGALNTLRDRYKIVEKKDTYIKLQRK